MNAEAAYAIIIEENLYFLRVLTMLLKEYYSEFLCVVGTSAGGDDALALVSQSKPHIILIGMGAYSSSCVECIARLRATVPDSFLLVLGSFDHEDYRRVALEAGADAFLAKADLNQGLLPLLAQVNTCGTIGRCAAQSEEGQKGGWDSRYAGHREKSLEA